MSPLDINQSDKGNDRIAVKAFETPGNSFAKGIYGQPLTASLDYDEWLLSVFYFPVDSCIWDIGCSWSCQTSRENIYEETVANTVVPSANQGVNQIGISLFSERDLPWNGSDGMTPMTPGKKMARDPEGGDMDWSADVIAGLGTAEVALRTRGYYNKAGRQLLYFDMMSSGTNKKHSIDFTKLSKKGKGKKRRHRAFDVSAGQKLVFWSRNVTGVGDSGQRFWTAQQMVPRVRFFPKTNIIQNYTYRDDSHDRWGATKAVTLKTEEGDGVYQLWSTYTADSTKD